VQPIIPIEIMSVPEVAESQIDPHLMSAVGVHPVGGQLFDVTCTAADSANAAKSSTELSTTFPSA
jgi:hypothetical protein